MTIETIQPRFADLRPFIDGDARPAGNPDSPNRANTAADKDKGRSLSTHPSVQIAAILVATAKTHAAMSSSDPTLIQDAAETGREDITVSEPVSESADGAEQAERTGEEDQLDNERRHAGQEGENNDHRDDEQQQHDQSNQYREQHAMPSDDKSRLGPQAKSDVKPAKWSRSAPGDNRPIALGELKDAYRKAEAMVGYMTGRQTGLGNKINQLTHAPELILMQLNMELSQIIDGALYSQLADQKQRNAMIADHQTMMDQLRIEKNNIADGDSFNWSDHNVEIDLHPESTLRPGEGTQRQIQAVMDKLVADPALWTYLSTRVEDRKTIVDSRFTAGKEGVHVYLKVSFPGPDGTVAGYELHNFYLPDVVPGMAPYIDKVRALSKKIETDTGKANLFDALIEYGVIEKGKEPGNGGAVEAVMQKLKGVIDKLSSSQQLDMVRLQKMTNSRNEAFSMISNVNKQALDNRMAIVNNLR